MRLPGSMKLLLSNRLCRFDRLKIYQAGTFQILFEKIEEQINLELNKRKI